jgi:hypothetical protein
MLASAPVDPARPHTPGHSGPGVLAIDAGVEHLRARETGPDGQPTSDVVIPNHGDLKSLFEARGVTARLAGRSAPRVVITGKLAATVRAALGAGRIVDPTEAFWMAGRRLMAASDANVRTLAMVDLSASGYLLVGLDRAGGLARDLLVVNPRCGAGSGINLDRVLQKLAVPRDRVDALLAAYAGEAGRPKRAAVAVRADRCGVFASSATISDKNQGIPLDVALATTLKSEVLKACRKLPPGFDQVCFSGRIFRWQFARDCAEDHARAEGVREVVFDPDNDGVVDAVARAEQARPAGADAAAGPPAPPAVPPRAFEGFAAIRPRLEAAGLYRRLPSAPAPPLDAAAMAAREVVIGLDVG